MPSAGSHARRKFFDIAKQSPAAKTAHAAVEKINALFTLERESAEAKETSDQRHERRQLEARPTLEKLKLWLDDELRDLLPKTPTAGAIGYCLRHWDALTHNLDDGRTRVI